MAKARFPGHAFDLATAQFGGDRPDFIAVLVIGRDTALGSTVARERWKWRSRQVAIQGRAVTLLTYDDLFFQFDTEIQSRF